MKTRWGWAAVAGFPLLGGCQTVCNLSGPDSEVCAYGGVVRNVEALKWAAQDPDGTTRDLLPLVALDLPLTVVADTLTLPYTLVKDPTLFARSPRSETPGTPAPVASSTRPGTGR